MKTILSHSIDPIKDPVFLKQRKSLSDHIKRLRSRSTLDTVRRALISTGAKLAVFAAVLATTGCLFHKTTTVTPGGTNTLGVFVGPVTNVSYTVDEANLALDSQVFQGVVAGSLSLLIQKDPGLVQPLKTTEGALNDIINGISQQSVQDVLSKLKAQSNPAEAQQISSLLQTASAVEQKLVNKYGSSVAGEISIAMVKAGAQGLAIALAGH